MNSNKLESLKQTADAVAAATPPSIFVAVLNGWLTTASLIMAILASAASFIWYIKRFRDSRRYRGKDNAKD